MNMPKAKEAYVVFDLGNDAANIRYTLQARRGEGTTTWRLHGQPPGIPNPNVDYTVNVHLDDAIMRAIVAAYNTMEQL